MLHAGVRPPRLDLERRRGRAHRPRLTRVRQPRKRGDVDLALETGTRRPDILLLCDRFSDSEAAAIDILCLRIRQERIELDVEVESAGKDEAIRERAEQVAHLGFFCYVTIGESLELLAALVKLLPSFLELEIDRKELTA